jgi:hypothetical protein
MEHQSAMKEQITNQHIILCRRPQNIMPNKRRQPLKITQYMTSVRKMLHIAHKGGSREVSHAQKFNKQAGWPGKNGAAASLGGSGLK